MFEVRGYPGNKMNYGVYLSNSPGDFRYRKPDVARMVSHHLKLQSRNEKVIGNWSRGLLN